MHDPPLAVRYISSLQSANRNSVGWLPKAALLGYVQHGNFRLQFENDDPCGYLLFGTAHGPRPKRDPLNLRITQVCIQVDARRLEQATKLIQDLQGHAALQGYHSLRLWCAADLDANRFWAAMGFACDGARLKNKTRGHGRFHLHWTRSLAPGGASLIQDPPDHARSAR